MTVTENAFREIVGERAGLSPLGASVLVMLGAAGVLLTALGFQYIGGYEPCALCHYQRWGYIAALGAGILGVAASRLPGIGRKALPWTLAAMGAGLAVSAGTAAYHVGVETGWWPGPPSCTGGGLPATLTELNAITRSAKPVVSCDTIPWAFLGLSMAGWNTLLAGGLALISFWGVLPAPATPMGAQDPHLDQDPHSELEAT